MNSMNSMPCNSSNNTHYYKPTLSKLISDPDTITSVTKSKMSVKKHLTKKDEVPVFLQKVRGVLVRCLLCRCSGKLLAYRSPPPVMLPIVQDAALSGLSDVDSIYRAFVSCAVTGLLISLFVLSSHCPIPPLFLFFYSPQTYHMINECDPRIATW
jgi:hypothetical protein